MQATYCLLAVIVLQVASTEASFVVEPSSINITQGRQATFTCTGYSLGSHWLVNERLPAHASNSHRGLTKQDFNIDDDYLKRHLLHVPAVPANDGISVQCFIYNSTAVPSDLVHLHIQGKLSAVTGVESFQVNSTTISLSFTPPLTLAGVPILNYSLLTHDDQLVYWTTEDTTVLLSVMDPCISHTVSISAWNELGEGQPFNYTFILYTVPTPPSSTPDNTSVVFSLDHVSATVLTIISSTDCIGAVPSTLTVLLTQVIAGGGGVSPVVELSSCTLTNDSSCSEVNVDKTSWTVSVNLSSHIQLRRKYKVQLIWENTAGNTSEATRAISTFETQSILTEITGNILCLDCFFGRGSSVTGCHGVFVDTSGSRPNQTLTVPRAKTGPNINHGRNCEELSPGTYKLFVYDKSENGVIESDGIAATKQLIITASGPTQTTSGYISTQSQVTAIDTTTSSSDTIINTSTIVTTSTAAINITPLYSRQTHSTAFSHPTVVNQATTDTITSTTLLLIVSFVVGSVLTFTLLTVILLAYCLVKTKKKNKKLKIAELSASERQRHAEVLLHSLTGHPHHRSNSMERPLYYIPAPTTGSTAIAASVDSDYENIEEVRIHAANRTALPEIQNCPAYAVPIVHVPKRNEFINSVH